MLFLQALLADFLEHGAVVPVCLAAAMAVQLTVGAAFAWRVHIIHGSNSSMVISVRGLSLSYSTRLPFTLSMMV